MKTYPTKTQATKAKKFGQTVRKRRDGTWVCEKPKVKVGKGRTALNIQAVDIESAQGKSWQGTHNPKYSSRGY